MKRLLIIAALFLGGCEVHSYPSGHTVTKFPSGTTTVDVVYTNSPAPPSQEVVVVGGGPVVVSNPPPLYEDFCVDSYYDYCCFTYSMWDEGSFWSVCERQECLDYYTGHWHWHGEDCWYE